MQGILFIICSPSGGGKGSIIKAVLSEMSESIGYSVSFTTRTMREGEQNGVDYFFVGREDFLRRRDEGEFLEWAEVHGNFYATSQKQVSAELNGGRDIILEIDVQGAEAVRKKLSEAVSVFILPPSYEVLRARLAARGSEKAEDLALRLKNSRGEVERFDEFDYIIVNDDLTKAVIELKSIVLAERVRRQRQIENVRAIVATFKAAGEPNS
jgi:guanylate kinase